MQDKSDPLPPEKDPTEEWFEKYEPLARDLDFKSLLPEEAGDMLFSAASLYAGMSDRETRKLLKRIPDEFLQAFIGMTFGIGYLMGKEYQ